MKKILSLLLCIVFLICMMTPLALAAEENTEEKEVIRVGWFDSPYFLEDENGRKSGYAYDYLLKIASYTGWEYEYVKGGWYELYQMLEKGEIDILADVTWSDDRLDNILYSSDFMGSEDLYIYTTVDNKEISIDDYSTLNGKDIAILSEPGEISMLKTWLDDNGVSPNIIVVTDDDVKIANDLIDGKYDAVANVTSFDTYSSKLTPLIKIDSDTIYFGINKKRVDIKYALDDAATIIINNNRTYKADLYTKYFGNAGNVKFLTTLEKEWIKENGTIRIGYRENYMPFSGTDENGNPIGLIKDFTNYIKTLDAFRDLKFELTPFKTAEAELEALKNGEVDCIFPITQAYDAVSNGISLSDELVSSDVYIVIRKSDGNVDQSSKLKVAVSKGNKDYEETLKALFPQWEIVYFDSTEECLKGIKNGDADCMLISNYRVSAIEQYISEYGLTFLPTGKSVNVCFATLIDNKAVYSIIDKLANELPNEDASVMLAKTSLGNGKVSVNEFVSDNLDIVIVTVLFIAFLIAFAVFQFQYNVRTEKMNKELILANAKAEKASNAKTEFLFNMSHDIRTPMNAILGFNNMAVRDIDDKEKTLKHLKKAQISGEALLSIINDILDTSRLESGKVAINTVSANVEKCFSESEIVLRSLAKNKEINISFNVIPMEHKYAEIDITHVDRILFNIVSNAIKYTPEGGTVTVEASEIPSKRDGYGRYKFVTQDNGIGISEEFQKEMFKPFTREENTTTSGIVGTGLGLSLVKSFVDLLDGEIYCESKLGEGTKMTVELEFKLHENTEPIEEEEENAEKEISLKDKQILLVEDNELNREIAMDILFEYEANVIYAVNGEDALEKLELRGISHFDFILMDIQMPIMDGYEATRQIRSKYPDIHIPIIALSANAFEQDKQKSKDAGMDAHIAKPIDIDEMLKTIGEVLK